MENWVGMSLYNSELTNKMQSTEINAPTTTNTIPNKFRIAVCFSGQPRYWKECANNIKRFFEFHRPHPETGQPVETDYFIHTWDTNTWRLPKTEHNVFFDEKHDDGEQIRNEFKPKSLIVENYVKDRFYLRSFDPLFYSLSRSLLLKRDYELQNNFQYDLVIKARLDVIYNPANKFPLQHVWPGICYTASLISKFPSEFNYNNFDDVLFYGNSPTMDLIGDLYNMHNVEKPFEDQVVNQVGINLDPIFYYGPGCLLYKYLTKLGIHPDGSRMFEYAVMRSTAIDAKLDAVYQYEEIRRKWFEWYI